MHIALLFHNIFEFRTENLLNCTMEDKLILFHSSRIVLHIAENKTNNKTMLPSRLVFYIELKTKTETN